ncbi:carboxy terminal-processing peptidase [Larkinella arboricola]|uniref:Carboxyl-terminal processing protease n=1 Tax=Larkinella arboricola TaxID=643671 RepID=A0A327X830_LARAB|nr:carboxy terminal-processing peptidase [Larkinella arboricola]RAK03167.1 carboxyl-terminal processing protease [Larkinella arboricola]
MRKYLITLVPVLMLSLQPGPHAGMSAVPLSPSNADDLKPSVSQEHVEQLVARLLTTHHYRKVKLNDSLSSVVFENYLKELDGNKAYFLASDISSFEKYRNNIDDQLINGELTAAYDIYNVFRKRYQERNKFVQENFVKPFDFTVDETFNTDREKASWPKSIEEQNDLWRKLLKNQSLELKLTGKADTSVVNSMKSRYKNLDRYMSRIKAEDVFQIYLNAFAESLDPHTNYMSPRSADRFNQEMSASLEGIGALLQEDGDYIKISDIVPGGPAFKSKLLTKGDKILGVAQGEGHMVNIVGYQVDDAVKLIKGPKGTTVRLQIKSMDAVAGAPPKEIRLVREKIKLEEQRAKKEVIEISQNNKKFKLGVITIPVFYRDFEGARKREEGFASTTGDVQRFLNELKTEKVDGVVVDLRDNGGGSLTEAITLTGLFISRGPVVQVKEATGDIEVQTDPDPSVLYDGPLAVLVNRFSASASEIFAAAIQDYKRGIIIGSQTYGKGTVQTMVDLNTWLKESEKVGQVKMTIAKFYRINGSSTQHKGVTPDIELPSAFSAEEYGESSQPSALPWDQIPSARFDATRNVDDKLIAKLRDRYEQRLKSDTEMKQLMADFAELKRAKEKTVVSLQEAKRKKERDEAEKRRKSITQAAGEPVATNDSSVPAKDPKDPKAPKKDLYLDECGKVLADYIAFIKNPQ